MPSTVRRISKYGWKPDLPDHRDRLFNLQSKVEQGDRLPGMVDLSTTMPPCYDQGQAGSCTGNGWAAVMEWQAVQENEPIDTPSRLFIYYNERVIENTVDQDSGAEIRDGAKVVVNLGAPSETLWPYDISQLTVKPSDAAYAAATAHKALEYQRVVVGGRGAPIRTAISQAHPIVFGFPVPDYFEMANQWNPATDALPLPGPNANIIGGHCVVAVGYDFTLQRFSVPVIKCRNSWGPSWGENGYFYMDAAWFRSDNSLASDLWIVKKVS